MLLLFNPSLSRRTIYFFVMDGLEWPLVGLSTLVYYVEVYIVLIANVVNGKSTKCLCF
jgi:hypothetical protein